MTIDLKRGSRNYFFLLVVILSILNVVLGYTLLKTIDKVEIVTFRTLWHSVYTVYTQFGPLLFSTLIIMQFYIDYKEKNIIFYKSLGKNPVTYFISKLTILLVGTAIGTAVTSLLICIPYSEYSLLPVVFLKIEAVVSFYCIGISLLGFLFSNFLLAFFLNFFLWIIGSLVSGSEGWAKYLAYYDASSSDYTIFQNFIDREIGLNTLVVNIGKNYVFDLVLLLVILSLVIIFNKRWVKNGV